MMELTSLHMKRYGCWGGNPNGDKAIPDRCAKTVCSNDRGAIPSQCARKRGHGPEGAYCKQHDPDAVAARRMASMRKYNAEAARDNKQWWGPKFLSVLEQIAAGHNDPQSIAREILGEFNENQKRYLPHEGSHHD